jgi:hypothetical protein
MRVLRRFWRGRPEVEIRSGGLGFERERLRERERVREARSVGFSLEL